MLQDWTTFRNGAFWSFAGAVAAASSGLFRQECGDIGTAPAIDMKQITLGNAGKGGPGDNGNLAANQGADGISAATQAFP